MKGEFDSVKGRTLEDMSSMVQQFNGKIANKRAALEPIVRELRTVRQREKVSAADLERFTIKDEQEDLMMSFIVYDQRPLLLAICNLLCIFIKEQGWANFCY